MKTSHSLAFVAAAAAAAMAATAILPGEKGIAIAFAATAASAVATFVGGGVGFCTIVGVAQRELGLINCA
jgi:hypothetical protein